MKEIDAETKDAIKKLALRMSDDLWKHHSFRQKVKLVFQALWRRVAK